MADQSFFPETPGAGSEPFQPVNNRNPVPIHVTGIDTDGDVVYSAQRMQGVELQNESATNDARVYVDGSTEGMLLPKVAGGIPQPRFFPGQGELTVKALAGTVDVSGLAY